MKIFDNCTGIGKLFLYLFIFMQAGFIQKILAQDKDGQFPEIPPYVLPDPHFAFENITDPMQSRLFKTTDLREQINLAGFWKFKTDPDSKGEAESYYRTLPEPETELWVPGSWNSVPRYWQYKGVAWYERNFETLRDGNLRIRFAGVFYKAKIWLDGKLLGENEGAYSPFCMIAEKLKAGNHRLTVKVDNSQNDESLPKDGADWFPFGGIHRPVYAEIIPDVFIDNFHIISADINEKSSSLTVNVYLKSLTKNAVTKNITFYINKRKYYFSSNTLNKGLNTVSFKVLLENPLFWSPDNPQLYAARVIMGDSEDDQYSRFGIRAFKTEGYKILLNGKRFKLMGANHHDDHPDWGSALPPNITRTDIEILKRMRANAVRGHYPPSEMFMDFCDSYGLVFMSEVPSWQYRPEQLANPRIKEKIKKQFFDMVYRDMNHPSVFSWSLGNEWREFQKSYNDIKELVAYARSVDTTHFLTFITGGAHIDQSAQLIDIICTNWSVYQWYWDPSFADEDSDDRARATVLDKKVAEESIRRLKKIHETLPDKPVILSEFGGSGSMAGWHNWGNVKWSEEYQAKNVWDSGKFALETDWISGGCVWQFCDTRTTHQRMLGPRLRGWNVKGVVDSYRLPKLAFYKLQDLFSNFQTNW